MILASLVLLYLSAFATSRWSSRQVKLRRPGFRCNCFRGDPSLEAPKSPKPSSPVRRFGVPRAFCSLHLMCGEWTREICARMSQTETRLQWRSRVDNSLRPREIERVRGRGEDREGEHDRCMLQHYAFSCRMESSYAPVHFRRLMLNVDLDGDERLRERCCHVACVAWLPLAELSCAGLRSPGERDHGF